MNFRTLLRVCAAVPIVYFAAHSSAESEAPAEASPAQTGAEKAKESALAWVGSLRSAERVELELYVRETHARSGNVFHQYARGAYTAGGFMLEVWTPEQHDRQAWSVDEQMMLVSTAPAEHTMELMGEEVHETILLDHETGDRQEYRYHRLDPLRDELLEGLRRMAAMEARESGISTSDWSQYIEARVSELLPRALADASSGIPITQARRFAKCLTGDAQTRYQGDGCMIESYEEYVRTGDWLDEPAIRNGSLCYGVIIGGRYRTSTLWFHEEQGLVSWETTQFDLDEPETVPAGQSRTPTITRERFYEITVTPPAQQQADAPQ